jgi:hypothetical protein
VATQADADPLMQQIMRAAKSRGMTVLDLSIESGVSHSTLSRQAVGRTSPRLKALRSLLDAIDCDVLVVPRGGVAQTHEM